MSEGDAPGPAEPGDPPDDDVEVPQVMLVRVGDERYAVPLPELREVLRARPATRVAGTPPWVLGLAAVRGALVPVADLARRASAAATADPPWLVVVERGGRQAAFGVTAVEGVHPVGAGMEPPVTDATLPRSGSVRLQSQGSGRALGAPDAVDVLDVGALFGELFEGD